MRHQGERALTGEVLCIRKYRTWSNSIEISPRLNLLSEVPMASTVLRFGNEDVDSDALDSESEFSSKGVAQRQLKPGILPSCKNRVIPVAQ